MFKHKTFSNKIRNIAWANGRKKIRNLPYNISDHADMYWSRCWNKNLRKAIRYAKMNWRTRDFLAPACYKVNTMYSSISRYSKNEHLLS